MENTTTASVIKQTLADIPSGKSCVIVKVNGHGGFRHRIMEMGFVRGEKVSVLKNAPLMDPIEYEVMQNHVALRRDEARQIQVVEMSDEHALQYRFNGVKEERDSLTPEMVRTLEQIDQKSKTITVALVGNPNSGKTSFFNYTTGMHEKVGNYSGVTVDSKAGMLRRGAYTLRLVDLPGTYSITEYTPEEVYVRQFMTENQPDVVLNVVDASNLERNLFLTTQLIDMNQRMVMCLNMYDELEKSGSVLDYKTLGAMLGFSIVPTISSKGIGVDEVIDAVINVYEENKNASKHIHINYGGDIERSITSIKRKLEAHSVNANMFPSRYIAIKLLENDSITRKEIESVEAGAEVLKEAGRCRAVIEKLYNEEASTVITDAKYGFIRGALAETFTSGGKKMNELAYAADKILTHKWLGFPVLFLFLWLMFQTTFSLGTYPQDWIESGVRWLSVNVSEWLSPGMLNDLLVDGIIAGVGGVIVFLPNILIMFMFISVLEDTGYMARAAFLMDRLMHKMGLHGKSFIPYLIGFGCSVPAIMATRILENRKDRIITILTLPFMSCSARLPVYLLLVGAFFPKHQGLVLMSIYLIGMIAAILTALLLRKTSFKKEKDQFVMELPPYRIPTLRNVLFHLWDKTAQYLKKMATIILFASILIWALGYFPRTSTLSTMPETQIEHSYIGRLGRFLEPVFRPLGFDWKMGVSLLTGLAAKETVVSTMGVLYQVDNADENSESLGAVLKAQKHSSGPHIGEALIRPVVAYSFMLFILLYIPCVASVTAIRREAGRAWATFSVFYTTALAWVFAFVVTNVGGLLF